MIVCTLTWTEPDDGHHTILFPDEAQADLDQVAAFVQEKMGGEVGHTIARMCLSPKKGQVELEEGDDPWGDLGLNVRYSSGEELYDEDCLVLQAHGVERS